MTPSTPTPAVLLASLLALTPAESDAVASQLREGARTFAVIAAVAATAAPLAWHGARAVLAANRAMLAQCATTIVQDQRLPAAIREFPAAAAAVASEHDPPHAFAAAVLAALGAPHPSALAFAAVRATAALAGRSALRFGCVLAACAAANAASRAWPDAFLVRALLVLPPPGTAGAGAFGGSWVLAEATASACRLHGLLRWVPARGRGAAAARLLRCALPAFVAAAPLWPEAAVRAAQRRATVRELAAAQALVEVPHACAALWRLWRHHRQRWCDAASAADAACGGGGGVRDAATFAEVPASAAVRGALRRCRWSRPGNAYAVAAALEVGIVVYNVAAVGAAAALGVRLGPGHVASRALARVLDSEGGVAWMWSVAACAVLAK